MVPNKTVCGTSGLISVPLICIYHQVTPEYICGLVLHFSVYQLNKFVAYDVWKWSRATAWPFSF